MGNYTATKMSVKLTADTPKYILDYFHGIFSPNDLTVQQRFAEAQVLDEMGEVKGVDKEYCAHCLIGCSAYHDGWTDRRFTIQSDGSWELCSYSSSKWTESDFLIALIERVLMPYISNPHGDILVKMIYEDHSSATVLWLDRSDGAVPKMVKESGYNYTHQDHHIEDSKHPSNSIEGQTFETLDVTPNTIKETRVQREATSKQY